MYTTNKGTMLSCDSDVTGKFRWALSLNHPLGRNICLKVTRDRRRLARDTPWGCATRGHPTPPRFVAHLHCG